MGDMANDQRAAAAKEIESLVMESEVAQARAISYESALLIAKKDLERERWELFQLKARHVRLQSALQEYEARDTGGEA